MCKTEILIFNFYSNRTFYLKYINIIWINDTTTVSSYRYWFDDDFTNVVNSNGNLNNLYSQIPLGNLSNGLHTIHFQFKGYNNKLDANPVDNKAFLNPSLCCENVYKYFIFNIY